MTKLTLEEVKRRTGYDDIVSFKITKDGFGEITASDGDKMLYTKDFSKNLTWWYISREITEDGLGKTTDGDGDKILYPKDFSKHLTLWFRGDYVIENGIIYRVAKDAIGRLEGWRTPTQKQS